VVAGFCLEYAVTIPWDVVTAVSGVLTAVGALLVYMEARRIRHTEWLTRSVQMWQGFNEVLLTDNRARRWRSFLDGEVSEADFEASDRYLLYTYLNILYSEYTYAKSGLLLRQYASESLEDNLRQVGQAGPYVIEWLRETGYDNELVDQIEIITAGGKVQFPSRIDKIRFKVTGRNAIEERVRLSRGAS
jgi:hypothetical protein